MELQGVGPIPKLGPCRHPQNQDTEQGVAHPESPSVEPNSNLIVPVNFKSGLPVHCGTNSILLPNFQIEKNSVHLNNCLLVVKIKNEN